MFGVKHNECVGFESRWSVKKVYYENATETPLYVAKNASTETNTTNDAEVQTDAPQALTDVNVDMEKLAKFLNNIYPSVSKELNEAASCRAFDGYKLTGEEDDTSSKLLQTITVVDLPTESPDGIKISSLSWNSCAKTVAVSLTHAHQTWCYDPGMILIYTLNREDKLPSGPSKKITCDSCVSQVLFHPTMPAILAGSTHSGDLMIWNVQNNEDNMVLVKISRNQNVSCLSWRSIDHITMDIVFLVVASLDGTITMWRFNSSYTCGNVYERYKIKPPLMGKTKPKQIKTTTSSADYGVGVTCFDFSKHFPDMFLVGTEGGLVVQCSTSKPTKLKGSTDIEPLYDPVYQHYQPHEVGVMSVQFSKIRKDIFLTNGMDFQTKIYLIGQEEPARVIFFNGCSNPLYWVPSEKHLVFGYGTRGKIDVYDVLTGQMVKGSVEEEEKDGSSGHGHCYVSPLKPNVVAVTLDSGCVELWMMPWSTYGKKGA